MCFLNARDEIRAIMVENGLSYQWIAERIGTYYQKIQYALSEENKHDMPTSLYIKIMNLFEKHNFIVSSTEACKDLTQLTLKTNSSFGTALKRLNDEIMNDIKDNKFSPEERLRFSYKLEEIQKEFNDTINEMKIFITRINNHA